MLLRLFDHLAWADARARDAVASLRAQSGERAQALALYAHVAAAEHVWLARLDGRPPDHPVWPSLDLDTAAALAREAAAGLRAHAALDADGLAREVAYRNSAGDAFRSRVDDILAHVALHGSYHRGQVALLARGGGGTPLPTDYIAFVRGSPAARSTGVSAAGTSMAGTSMAGTSMAGTSMAGTSTEGTSHGVSGTA